MDRRAACAPLEIARHESVGRRLSALGVAACEIHAAHRPEPRMAAERGTRNVETRIEDVLAMLPGGQTVINDQREDDIARRGFPVRNIFAPTAGECSVAGNSFAGVATVPAFMAKSSRCLIRAMISRGPAHSGRNRERRNGLRILQKPDRLVDCDRAFLRPDAGATGKDHGVAIHRAPQLLHECGVERRVLPGQIHFPNHSAS